MNLDILKEAVNKGYSVDKGSGQILNKNGFVVKSSKSGSYNYYKFCIRFGRTRVTIAVHRFVGYLKYGIKIFEKGIHVRHLNSNSLDNCWDNIGIGTASDNMMDKPLELRLKQAKHAASYNVKYDKIAVKNYYNNCKSYNLTMEEFKISSKGTLWHILNK